jgi:hypothetical protein
LVGRIDQCMTDSNSVGIIYWWGISGGGEKVKNLYWEGAGGGF